MRTNLPISATSIHCWGCSRPRSSHPSNSLVRSCPMQDDPTLDHVREVRHRISEQCAHDPKRLVEYYIQLQAKYANRLLEQGKDNHAKATPAPASQGTTRLG